MRNLLIISILSLMCLSVYAQNPKKLMGQANKELSAFLEDPVTNEAKLAEAESLLADAMSNEEFASQAKSWLMKGDFHADLATAQILAAVNNQTALTDRMAAIKAYEAYMKAHELSTKKGDKKKAVAGLIKSEDLLNNTGAQLYQDAQKMADPKVFGMAHENWKASVDVSKTIQDAGEVSRLSDAEMMKEQMLFTGISAYQAQDFDNAMPYYLSLYEQGSDEATVYDGLYRMSASKGSDDAITYLEAGREKFPDDTSLLFSEINYYLEKGELDVLIGKLEQAIAKEPDNTSVLNTMGSVYDNLHTAAKKEGDLQKSQEYFDLAKSYYDKVLAKDPDQFDATYSIGALYYNRAANMADDINALADDYTAEGTKKYNALKEKMDGYFSESMPFFQRAEEINPKDLNTLIALKEIYARQSNFDKVAEYEKKMKEAQM